MAAEPDVLPKPPTAARPLQGSGRSGDLLALALALVSGFGLLELGSRVVLFGVAGLSPTRVQSVREIGDSGLLRPSESRDILFELRPDLDTYFKTARVVTNSAGLRDRHYDLEKPEGSYRIVVLGDSYTMAAGSDIEGAYHTRLDPLLYNLEAKGWVRGTWRTASSGRRRKYYALTAGGIKRLKAQRHQWERLVGAMESLDLVK